MGNKGSKKSVKSEGSEKDVKKKKPFWRRKKKKRLEDGEEVTEEVRSCIAAIYNIYCPF